MSSSAHAAPALRPRRAFTLVEVMLAMAVLTMLLIILSQVLNQTIRSWRKGEAQHEHRRVERTLTDFLALEMRGALLPLGEVPTAATVPAGARPAKNNLQFVINPPASQVPNEYRYADAVFWQAPVATETTFGDLAVLGYFVKWRDTDAGKQTQPVLCRLFINPSTTSGGVVGKNNNFRVYDADPQTSPIEHNPQAWLTQEILDAEVPATVDKGLIGLFAENVLGLWIECYGPDGNRWPRGFDSRKGYKYEYPAGTELVYSLPPKITVSIAQMDGRRAELVAAHAKTLKDLAQSTQITNAAGFQEKLREEAAVKPELGGLVIGLQIYVTDVRLTNFK